MDLYLAQRPALTPIIAEGKHLSESEGTEVAILVWHRLELKRSAGRAIRVLPADEDGDADALPDQVPSQKRPRQRGANRAARRNACSLTIGWFRRQLNRRLRDEHVRVRHLGAAIPSRWIAPPMMYCPDCETNLDAVPVGDACPSCGGLRRSAVVTPATAAVGAFSFSAHAHGAVVAVGDAIDASLDAGGAAAVLGPITIGGVAFTIAAAFTGRVAALIVAVVTAVAWVRALRWGPSRRTLRRLAVWLRG